MRPSWKVTLGYEFWVGILFLPKIDTFVGVMYVCFKPMINWDKLKEEAWFEDGAVRFDFVVRSLARIFTLSSQSV